jgi:Fungal Zn(2)-Cys(6) binuclear cluster domain.
MCLCEKSGTAPLEIFGGALALGIAIFNIADANANTTMETLQARKRPRPVVSCLRCREKKLKCDRVVPCQNCVNRAAARTAPTLNNPPSGIRGPRKVQLTDVNDHDQDRKSPHRSGDSGHRCHWRSADASCQARRTSFALRPQGTFGTD